MKRYGLLCGPLAALTLWTGIAGLAQFVPGYDSIRQTVSEIGEMDSPERMPFAAMLFVVAILSLVFAWAVYGVATEAGRSRLAVYLIAFIAVPLIGIAVCAFPHPLHGVFGLSETVSYFAPIVLAVTWRRAPGAQSVVTFSWVMAVVVWIVLFANLIPIVRPEPLWHEMKPFYGVVQRALFVSWFAWVAGVGLILASSVGGGKSVTEYNWGDLSTAILLYTQHGNAKWPQSDEAAVVKEFGEGDGTVLLDQIRELVAEMRMIVVDWKQHSLASAADFVREEIRKRYPRLTGEALEALAWKWSFENR